jgi:hypothetical protein
MQYSVLLTYPDSLMEGTLETFYEFVDADTVPGAVQAARLSVARRFGYALLDLTLLLVIAGHHADYPYEDDESGVAPDDLVTCRECDTLTPKALARPNRAGDGWIGDCCWQDYHDRLAEEA